MSFFGINFGQNADVDIILDNQDERKMAEIRDENGRKERHYLFFDGESVTGKVNVTLHRKTHRLEHQGIKIEFIGQIELYYDRGNHHEFLSLVKELARPGDLTQNTSFDFEFNQVEKPYECYTGVNVRLRYFLRVTIVRRLTDMTKEMDILVHSLSSYPEMNNPIKMEVGIEECLHIEFEYNKSKYHLKDVIVGKIYFLLVRIKIKYMEVAIIKRETTGSGPSICQDSETIAKYEIMDGAPVKGESIPIRVFLAGYDLTPTMRDINKKFSVRYYLNLVLVDEEERRYFKQQEVTLWRKCDRPRKLIHHAPQQQGVVQSHVGTFPHALARHNPGEFSSENVRTAPTPSEPNTPATEYVTGATTGNAVGGAEYLPGPLSHGIEEEGKVLEDAIIPSTNEDNGEVVDSKEPDSLSEENETSGSPCTEAIADGVQDLKVNAADDEVAKEIISAVSADDAVASVARSREDDIDDMKRNPLVNSDDDRPLPPEDDSVPDIDDSLVLDDDEDIFGVGEADEEKNSFSRVPKTKEKVVANAVVENDVL